LTEAVALNWQQFSPQMEVESVLEIHPEMLVQHGIRAIITDLDNTLVRTFEPDPTPEILDWLKKLEAKGIQVLILSNNSKGRVEPFARKCGLPYIARAKKPLNDGFRRALKQLDVRADQTMMLGDQLMTDIFGGNRMRLYTVWVKPIEQETDGRWTKINRMMERMVLQRLKRNG
jgi:uncharacterized protein